MRRSFLLALVALMALALVTCGSPSKPTHALDNCFPNPSVCGYPDGTSTGVPAGVTLTPSGGFDTTAAGQVIDALNVSGRIGIHHNNVTVKRSRITMSPVYGSGGNEAIHIDTGITGTLVQDVEIDGGVPVTDPVTETYCLGGWAWGTTTITRVNCHNIGVLAQQPSNATITDSYVHDLQFGSSTGTHTQAIAVQNGSRVVYRHNTVDGRNASTAPVFVQAYGGGVVDDVGIDNNLIAGDPGNYYLVTQDADGSGDCTKVTNTNYTNNRWAGRDSPPRNQFNFTCNYTTWSGNVWDIDGTLITAP